MSVSLLEVIEAGGYDLTTREDCEWLLSKVDEMADLMDKASNVIEKLEVEKELKDLKEELEDESLDVYEKQAISKVLKSTQDYYDKYLKENK